MNIESLLKKSINGNLEYRDLVQYANLRQVDIEDALNELSLLIAVRYMDEAISYEDGDFAINEVWTHIIHYICEKDKSNKLPDPAYSIYDAFDQGEHTHIEGCDPIKKYTQPLLRKVLKNV